MWGDALCDKAAAYRLGQLIVIKGVRISDFGGKSLNMSESSNIFTNLENKDAQRVKSWYDNKSASSEDFMSEIRSLTIGFKRDNEARDNQVEKKSNLSLIAEINSSLQGENDTDQAHFFYINGYVARVKNDERIYYPACKGEGCRRKVIEDSNGYRCEHCNQTFADFEPTYMITAKISDFTESIHVTFAREQGTQLMGMTAQEFMKFKNNNTEEDVQEYFDKLHFKTYNLMVKGKYSYYNGEQRMKYFVVKVFPHNVQSENKALLKRLAIYENL